LGDLMTSVNGVVDGSLNFGKKERSVSICDISLTNSCNGM
jgi:hypothetical protein